MNKKIQVKILNNKIGKSIPLPSYTTSGSAAMDLRACINESIQLQSKKTVLVPTGLAFYIEDKKYAGIVLPRSGLGHKHGIILGNSVGLIDSDYQGELMVSLFNNSTKNFEINPVLIFASAPATLKYLKIVYFELYLLDVSIIKFSNSSFDEA